MRSTVLPAELAPVQVVPLEGRAPSPLEYSVTATLYSTPQWAGVGWRARPAPRGEAAENRLASR